LPSEHWGSDLTSKGVEGYARISDRAKFGSEPRDE